MWRSSRPHTRIRAPTEWQPADSGAGSARNEARDVSRKCRGPRAFSRAENDDKDHQQINRGLALFTFAEVKFGKEQYKETRR